MQKLFIVDASGYLYSSYFAIRNMTNSKGESTNALFGFIRSILKLFKDFHPDHIVAVFDGPRNAKKREEIYPEYKAHRSTTPQDLSYQIQWAQEFCSLIGIPYLNIPEVEADDTMGAVAKWAEKQSTEIYLCTSDKDLCQLVNNHIRLLNTRKENQIVGPEEVEKLYGVPPSLMIDLLAMIGDASDNVPGIPGIGPKTAAALLKQFGSLDSILTHPQEIAGEKKRAIVIENVDKALLSRRLVTIDLSVNIPHDSHFYKLKNPDIQHLKSFYAKMSFNSLLKEVEVSGPQEKGDVEAKTQYILINDGVSLNAFKDYLLQQNEICIETETTHVQPIKAELIGLGFGTEPYKAWYIPLNGALSPELVLETMKPVFENPKICFYGHNIKYDYQILGNYGIELANICFDTMLASYILNSHQRQHSLDFLALTYFGKVRTPVSDLVGKGKSLISLREVPIEKLCQFCCEDIDFICRLKVLLENELKGRQLEKVMYELELPLLKVLAGMERHGIYLDIPCLKEMSLEIQMQIQNLEKEIFAIAGEVFNINSPKQLSQILQHKLHITLPKKTATGFSTNADILEDLKNKHPIASLLLEYRTLEKLRSTYVENLPNEVYPKTQRIHCTFNQTVAATGRLSCQDPNLQNIPIRTKVGSKIREAFHPQKKGWSYLAADYSQIELRLLAHLSEDPNLIHAFNNNEDIHTYTAALIFNIPIEKVTKEQRYSAKAVNFGIIYGQQAFGLSQELKIDLKEAAAFIEMYFQRYPHVKGFLEMCKAIARESGKATTFTGRERLIPEIHSKNAQLRMLAERLAVNTPIQGAAADLIKLAMLAINQKLLKAKPQGYMILQIHDELIFEVPDEEIEFFNPLVKETMQNVLKLKVPLIVDITLGKNWKEC